MSKPRLPITWSTPAAKNLILASELENETASPILIGGLVVVLKPVVLQHLTSGFSVSRPSEKCAVFLFAAATRHCRRQMAWTPWCAKAKLHQSKIVRQNGRKTLCLPGTDKPGTRGVRRSRGRAGQLPQSRSEHFLGSPRGQ